MSLRIKSVDADGLGAYLGLKPGDRLLKINGRNVPDPLDYQFRMIDPAPVLELEIDGQREEVEVEKDEDVDLGVSFEDFTIRSCANDCIFCFVDQNPSGLRSGLYFRDGDYRLSFLYGHYITMTNMGWRELERIVEQRLSPLYISVHATDPGLRQRLLLYGKDDQLLDKMHYLVNHGIKLHSQIVLCPGLNDGGQLWHTLDDLMPLSPKLRSVAIVPVGLTAHRAGLVEIPPVTPTYAEAFLEEYADLDRSYRHGDGGRFVLPSDEWYILAGADVPPAGFYEDLAIEENGVGQVRAFLDRFRGEAGRLPKGLDGPARFTIATGELAAGIFRDHVLPRLNAIDNLSVELEVVPNTLFGNPVIVAGLLSGQDFLKQLAGKDLGMAVWTTDRILSRQGGISSGNDAGEVTLDDMTPAQIGERLGVPFHVASDSLLDLFARGIHG